MPNACKALRQLALIAATMCAPSLADTVNARFPRDAHDRANVFTRMFADLPPFTESGDATRNALRTLGAKGGLLDAQDVLTDPIQSILNQPLFSPNNFDNLGNPAMTAGMTFFGQFLDHDVTLDRRSGLLERADPSRTVNFRSAAFDLDSVYGQGPERSPELYDVSGGDIRMLVHEIPGSPAVSRKGAMRHDLPRDAAGDALVGDSRNDENVILSQLHVAMLRMHNAVNERLRSERPELAPRERFAQAQRLVRWHYQWIIVNEFLPATIGADRLEQIRRQGLRYYDVERSRRDGGHSREPKIPIEFSVAAYRFGHSQVRPSYRLNFGPDGGAPFFAFALNDQLDPTAADPEDLRGGRRAARRFVDWQTFFDFGDGNVRPNKRIDTKLTSSLFELPGSRAPLPGLPTDGVQSLASRNLMRHVNFGLPSGQAIARRMRVPVLGAGQLAELAPHGMSESTPLWYYVLKEAEVMEGGRRLGPVGARIVGEVFIGLLRADRSAYLAAQPDWRPTLPSASGPGTFRITDLLRLAGVVPPLQ